MLTPHKKAWKLKKAASIQKLKAKDNFLQLLNQLDIMSFECYMDTWQEIESQKEMIASTIYEAINDES